MDIPGYTADASLGASSSAVARSRTRNPRGVAASQAVLPSRWSWQNVWDGAVAHLFDPPVLLVPGRPNCELSCGADRARCFRMGGTRETCDRVQDACLMECFFSG